MWLFTTYGFFSVVAARKDRGRSPEVDPGVLQVRARVRAHLEALVARFPDMGRAGIVETPNADYRFRVLVPRSAWVRAAAALAAEVAYPNFKAACRGQSDGYVDALHEVWGVMNDLQEIVHGDCGEA